MKVSVEYHGQMRALMGRTQEVLEVEEGCTVGKIVVEKQFKGLMFVGTQQVKEDRVLRDGDVIVLLSPIAGG